MFSTIHVRADEIRAVRLAASKERELRTSRTGGGRYLCNCLNTVTVRNIGMVI